MGRHLTYKVLKFGQLIAWRLVAFSPALRQSTWLKFVLSYFLQYAANPTLLSLTVLYSIDKRAATTTKYSTIWVLLSYKPRLDDIDDRYISGVSRLVYDSCQNNLFSRGKMWKCIASITMNLYSWNISINSTMLLSTYEPTQLTRKNVSNDSIKSIDQLNILLTVFGKTSISLIVFGKSSISLTVLSIFWFNWIKSIILVAQSIDSTTYPVETNWSITNQLTWKRNWINSINFIEKNESVQIYQLIRVDWYTSLGDSAAVIC